MRAEPRGRTEVTSGRRSAHDRIHRVTLDPSGPGRDAGGGGAYHDTAEDTATDTAVEAETDTGHGGGHHSGHHLGDDPDAAGRRWIRPTLVGLLASVVLAALSVGGGLWWAGTDRPDQAVLPASDSDWTSVVRLLDERRSAAFRDLDPGLLTEVYVAGAAPLSADTEQLAAIAAADVRVDGAAHLIQSVTMVDELASPGPLVAVVDSLPSYPIRRADGTVVGRTAGTTPARRLLSLVRQEAGYRIAGITPDPAG